MLHDSISVCLCSVEISSYKQSLEETATKYSFEVATSKGAILFNLYDWAWEEVKKTQNINQQLMRGCDGCLFVYDVNHRQSKSDFTDHLDFYSRAAGFGKSCLIISNKNDSKKKAVQDGEGQALAAKGDKRAYCAISLVDDSGIDDLILSLTKLVLCDPNVSVSSFKTASPEILAWSEEKAASKLSAIGLGMASVKTHRIMLIVMNSSVAEKFTENFVLTEFIIEASSNANECEQEMSSSSGSLPIACILAPPTCSGNQQDKLKALAAEKGIPFIISIPKEAPGAVKTALTTKP